MNCANHDMRAGVNSCGICGSWLCEECSLAVDGRIICKACVSELLNANAPRHSAAYEHRHEHTEHRRAPAHEHRHEHTEHRRAPRYEHREYERPGSSPRRRISAFWLFVMSFTVPGINYMFMGLIKRGIYAMSAFLLSFYFAIDYNMPVLGLLCGVIYVVSIFDGFKVRRMLLADEYVEDGFSGIISAMHRNKLPIGIITLLLIASNVLTNIRYYPYGYRYNSSGLFITLVIAAVLYFLFKPARKARKSPESDIIDERDQAYR